jgi:hypothetical protein
MKNDLLPGMIVTHMVHGGKYLFLSIQENEYLDHDYNVVTFNLRNRIIIGIVSILIIGKNYDTL